MKKLMLRLFWWPWGPPVMTVPAAMAIVTWYALTMPLAATFAVASWFLLMLALMVWIARKRIQIRNGRR